MATPVILVTGHEGTAAVTVTCWACSPITALRHFGQWHQDPCGEPIPAHGVTAENNDDDTGHP